jgi:lactoylglutathione lyase
MSTTLSPLAAARPPCQHLAVLTHAFGYQGDTMHLPVPNLEDALPFYESVLGFRVVSRGEIPHKAAVLERDQVRMGLEENGGDPSQDGCAFHVTGLQSLFDEFCANGLTKGSDAFSTEQQDGVAWRVFYVVAPDGLCFWFGERHTG